MPACPVAAFMLSVTKGMAVVRPTIRAVCSGTLAAMPQHAVVVYAADRFLVERWGPRLNSMISIELDRAVSSVAASRCRRRRKVAVVDHLPLGGTYCAVATLRKYAAPIASEVRSKR